MNRQSPLETVQYVVSSLLLASIVIIFAVFTVYDRTQRFLVVYNLAAEMVSIISLVGYFRSERRKRQDGLSRISTDRSYATKESGA